MLPNKADSNDKGYVKGSDTNGVLDEAWLSGVIKSMEIAIDGYKYFELSIV